MYWDVIHEQNLRARNPQLRLEAPAKRDTPAKKPTMRRTPSKPKMASFNLNPCKVAIASGIAIALTLGAIGLSATGGQGANSPTGAEVPALNALVSCIYPQNRHFHENADNLQFSQTGEYWKILGYWNSNVGYTGCGLCSYTTAIDIVTASNYTPLDMLSLRGDWAGMDNYIDDTTGLDDRTHGEFTYDMFKVSSRHVDLNTAALAEALQDNSAAVICTGGDVFYDVYGNNYYYDGHFVCAYRYDADTGIFHVHDSAIEHELGTDVHYTWEQMDDMLAYTTSIVAYKAV